MNISNEVVILIIIGVIVIAFLLTRRKCASESAEPEVYVVYANVRVSSKDVDSVAKAMGAQVATFAQLSDAQKDGAQWCKGAWITNFPKGLQAWYPMQYLKATGVCGSKPLNHFPGTNITAVTLYGIKPKSKSMKIGDLLYKVMPWYQPVVKDNEGKYQWSRTREGYCGASQPHSKTYFNPHRDYEMNHSDCANGEVHCLLSDGTEGRCNLHNICSPHFSKFSPQPGGYVTMPRA